MNFSTASHVSFVYNIYLVASVVVCVCVVCYYNQCYYIILIIISLIQKVFLNALLHRVGTG